MLGLDLIFGNPLKPDILGMVAGHLYYFLTVLHPLAGGKFKFNTPLLVYPFLLYINLQWSQSLYQIAFIDFQDK